MTRYAKPRTLDEALAALDGGKWRILAGGTDFYPAQGNRPFRDDILDINGLAELRGISETDSHFSIGARTTWTEVAQASHLPPAFAALRAAAREVGSVQIQNVATVAGNLCNASPAADGVPPLLVLEAEVALSSARGVRHVPLSGFILGNRRTALAANELVTAIRLPKTATGGASSFMKLGARRYLVISIAMAAARLQLAGDGRIEQAAIAVGACSAVAQRLATLEQALIGQPATQTAFAEAVADASFAELSPIDDVRGSADYRHAAAREIVLRALGEAGAPAGRGLAA